MKSDMSLIAKTNNEICTPTAFMIKDLKKSFEKVGLVKRKWQDWAADHETIHKDYLQIYNKCSNVYRDEDSNLTEKQYYQILLVYTRGYLKYIMEYLKRAEDYSRVMLSSPEYKMFYIRWHHSMVLDINKYLNIKLEFEGICDNYKKRLVELR